MPRAARGRPTPTNTEHKTEGRHTQSMKGWQQLAAVLAAGAHAPHRKAGRRRTHPTAAAASRRQCPTVQNKRTVQQQKTGRRVVTPHCDVRPRRPLRSVPCARPLQARSRPTQPRPTVKSPPTSPSQTHHTTQPPAAAETGRRGAAPLLLASHRHVASHPRPQRLAQGPPPHLGPRVRTPHVAGGWSPKAGGRGPSQRLAAGGASSGPSVSCCWGRWSRGAAAARHWPARSRCRRPAPGRRCRG